MRYGVMDMQQIQILRLRHLHHLHSEGKRVGSVVKQRVAGDFHFMKLDVVVGFRQPDRRRVTDEVDFMASRGQLHSKLSGDHTRAAVGWVTGYPNLHVAASEWLACS